MWHLIIKAFSPQLVMPMYYKEALGQSVAQVVEGLVAARRARWGMSRNLEEMVQGGRQQTTQFREMQAAYQQLSANIEQAQQVLKNKQDRLTQELGPTNPLARFFNFVGIGPLGASTLGPAESKRPGLVSRGDDVLNLQKFLRAVGFQLNPTGEFDLQTRLVLQKFQEQHELPSPAETIVGIETRQLINDMMEGK